MADEIERKFLVAGDGWRRDAQDPSDIVQGYLHVDDDASVRVRIRDDAATLTVKRGGAGIRRREVEVPLALDAARTLLEEARVGRPIRKRRWLVPAGDLVAEIDVFEGGLHGLVVAEFELDDEDQEVPRPVWLGAEVTGDARYANAALATREGPPPG